MESTTEAALDRDTSTLGAEAAARVFFAGVTAARFFLAGALFFAAGFFLVGRFFFAAAFFFVTAFFLLAGPFFFAARCFFAGARLLVRFFAFFTPLAFDFLRTLPLFDLDVRALLLGDRFVLPFFVRFFVAISALPPWFGPRWGPAQPLPRLDLYHPKSVPGLRSACIILMDWGKAA